MRAILTSDGYYKLDPEPVAGDKVVITSFTDLSNGVEINYRLSGFAIGDIVTIEEIAPHAFYYHIRGTGGALRAFDGSMLALPINRCRRT